MTVPESQEAARRLAAIVSSSADAIVSKDLNGAIQSWNAAAERLFGYSEIEAIGQSILLIIPEDRRAEEEEVLRRIRRGERVEPFDTVRKAKDGRLVPVSVAVSPIVATDGTIVGASKIARDISERRLAEERMSRLEAERADLHRRLLALMAASQAIVGRTDQADVLAATMELARQLVAADAHVIWRFQEGIGWSRLVSVGVSDRFAVALAPTTEQAALLAGPVVIRDVRADPRVAFRAEQLRDEGIVSLLAIPLRPSGQIGGTLVFYYRTPHDFSEVEIQTASALGSLAAAGIAAAELHEQERRAREEARQALLIKDQFLATLSHELRTPLNAIVGYTRMMLKGTLPDDRQQHALQVMARNGTSLTQIVEDVLDVSRIVADKLAIRLEPLDLVPLVQHATETIVPMAEEKGVRLTIGSEASSLLVDGDEHRLRQVVWNLVTNAVKFTPAGGLVAVSLMAGEGVARLQVTDTGVGIPVPFLSLIFEPFRQADTRPSREYGGLGLGLAITRRLVELHGGTISATSDGEGTGARFEMVLPLRS